MQETSESTEWVLGIDVGGTGSRAALEPAATTTDEADGEPRRALDGPPVSITPSGSTALGVVGSLIERARAEWPEARISAVGIGATGLASLVSSPAA
ncbi:MAG: hypothetical protein ACRDT9_16380, partial [Agromyces sp.]